MLFFLKENWIFLLLSVFRSIFHWKILFFMQIQRVFHQITGSIIFIQTSMYFDLYKSLGKFSSFFSLKYYCFAFPLRKNSGFSFSPSLTAVFLFQMQINCNWINEKLCHFFSHIRWIYSSFWFKNVWIPMWIIYENFDISQYKYLWKMFSLLEFFLVFPFNRLNSLPKKKENLE